MVNKFVVVAAMPVGVLLQIVVLKQFMPTNHSIALSVGVTSVFALYQLLDSSRKNRPKQPTSTPTPENPCAENKATPATQDDQPAPEQSPLSPDPPTFENIPPNSIEQEKPAKSKKISSKKKSSHWNADEIIKGLFVGDKKAAMSKDELHRHHITHILSLFGNTPAYPDEFKYLTMELLDSPTEDLLQKFPITNQFIDEGRAQGGGVLVHCEKGVSRSATISIAYIMSSLKKTFEEAMEMVTTARPSCLPNFGFLSQLELYGGMGCNLHGDSEYHRKYAVFKLRARASVLREKWLEHTPGFSIADELANDPRDDDTTAIKCRKCERVVFSSEHVIKHERGQDVLTDRAAAVPECNSVFVFPLRWMASSIENGQSGTLSCPNCAATLGSFDWNSTSVSCSCQYRFRPAFLIANDAVH